MKIPFPKPVAIILMVLIVFREWRKGYFKGMGARLRTLKLFPLFQPLLFFGILTALVFFKDPVSLHRIQALHQPFFIFLSDFGGMLGKNINPWTFLVGWYVLGGLAKRIDWSQLAFGSLVSSVFTAFSCLAFKFMFLRARPNAGQGPHSFFNLDGLLKDDGMFQSFPSGDVAVVAGSAAFLFYSIKNRYGRGLIALLPLTTAFSRVYLNRHWPTDTLFSLGLSLVCAKLIYDCRRVEGEDR